jgi:hypothetical protein
MNLAYQISIKRGVFFSLLFLTVFDSIAQSVYDQAGDDDIYSDYGYQYSNYSNSVYEISEEEKYRKRQERFYKKSYDEEDLYNGGYRVKSRSSEVDYYAFGGIGSGNISNQVKSWFNSDSKNESPLPSNQEKYNNNEVGTIDGIDRLGEDGKSGLANNKDNGEILQPKDDKQTETAPPPPDEPDIPITSPLLSILMIVIMIGIAVFYLSNRFTVL